MSNYLVGLEVFGFDKVEPAILAALVTEDPLLLIGRSGTGLTVSQTGTISSSPTSSR